MNNYYIFLKKHKFAVMWVVLAILVICLIATAVHFRSGSSDKPQTDNEIGESVLNGESISSDALTGDTLLLFVCTGDSKTDIVFSALFDFRIYSEKIIVTPLRLDTQYSGRTYEESFAYGGIDELISAVESVRKRSVDRYAVIDRDGFCSMFDILGKITLDVTEDYTYESSDKSSLVKKGENELDSSMLYSYFSLNAEKSDAQDRLGELICIVVNTFLSSFKDTQIDAYELFGDLSNCVNTDVTVNDYYSCASDIEYLLSHDTVCETYGGAL